MLLGEEKNIKRKLWFVMTVLVAVLALLLSQLADFTLSRYRQSVDGYTDFSISSFHAVLLGDMTKQDVIDSWTSSSAIKLFGTDVNLNVIQPGRDTQSLPFSLANGTSEDNISSMDFDYVLRVRTTGNIPLQFVLKEVISDAILDEEGNVLSSGLYKEYRSAEDCFVERDRETDAPRYIYPLYEVKTDAEGNPLMDENGNYQMETQEHSFTMKGGVLDLKRFILELEWPIIAATEEHCASNDQKYMKEVDVVDMIANVSSHNRADTYGDEKRPTEHDFFGEGILAVYPNAEKVITGETECYVHQFDYRAFRETNAKDKAKTEEALGLEDTYYYSYPIYVTNGNNLFRGGQPLAQNGSDYTDFHVSFGIPMTEDAMVLSSAVVYSSSTVVGEDGEEHEIVTSSAKVTLRDYVFCLENETTGELTVLSSAVSYRVYDLYTGKYKTVTEEEANELFRDDEYVYLEDARRVYAVYTLLEKAENASPDAEPEDSSAVDPPLLAEGPEGSSAVEDPEGEEPAPAVPGAPKTFRLKNFAQVKNAEGALETASQFDQLKFRIFVLGGLPAMPDVTNLSRDGLTAREYQEAMLASESKLFMEVTAEYNN